MARITFRFENPVAKTVALVGDFNDWNPSTHPMKRGRGKVWSLEVECPPGRHEYKFLVNGGEWWNDPHAPKVPNVWGTENSCLDVQ